MIRIIALSLFLATGFLVEPLTWGFSLARYRLTPQTIPSFGAFPQELCNKTWTLAAQGGQSYVFMSEDGTHVLKFFKDQPRPFLLLPSYQAFKNKKLHRTLTGYALLSTRAPDLSATICLHTELAAAIPATLIDRLGIHHTIDLNSYLFALQRRVEPIDPHADKEAALAVVQTLASHHLHDHDPRLHLNLGKTDGKLLIIDPGKIALSENPPTTLPSKFLESL